MGGGGKDVEVFQARSSFLKYFFACLMLNKCALQITAMSMEVLMCVFVIYKFLL